LHAHRRQMNRAAHGDARKPCKQATALTPTLSRERESKRERE